MGGVLLDRSNMAATGLLSSPARMAHQDSVVIISSSPEFPSICDLLPKATKRPPLRSGSNAAPIPDDAPAAFTSAATVWQSTRPQRPEEKVLPNSGDVAKSDKPPALRTTKLPGEAAGEIANPEPERKRVAPMPNVAGTTKAKKTVQPRGATSKAVMEIPAAEALPKKAARKPRATKDASTAQTVLSKGKVTKPAAKEAQSRKRAETVSRHFGPQVSAPAPAAELAADPIQDEPVNLEPALRRRMDWTPPRETAVTHSLADSSATQEPPSSRPAQGDLFKTLQDTYGRNADTGHPNSSLTNADVLGKRKLIEMVPAAGHRQRTPEDSQTKHSAVKKKPRTITELATAAYRVSEVDDVLTGEPKQDSLLGYLENTKAQTNPTSKAVGAAGKAPRKPAKPKEKPKRKEQASKQLLLSPTSAMRQVARQDFVFGTASQLATEEDPELLRALHEAMKASNQPDSDPFASPDPANTRLTIRKRQGAGLWAAGARFDGELVDMEVLDLTRSSPLPLTQTKPQNPFRGHDGPVQGRSIEQPPIEIEMSDDTLDVNNSPPVSHPTRELSASRLASEVIQLDDSSPLIRERPQTPAQEPDFEPPPSNQEQHQLLLSQSSSPRREQPVPPPRPDFELYTDARLAKEVASYGFKAMKKRTAMIALLNKCWESKNKSGLGSRTAQATMSTSSVSQAASPSRPRGRSRNSSAASTADRAETAAGTKRGTKKLASVSNTEAEAPAAEKRPRGRPRKNSTVSVSDVNEAVVPKKGARKDAIPAADKEPPQGPKRPRGRPKKDTAAPPAKASRSKTSTSPKRAKSPPKPAAPSPRRRRASPAPKTSAIEIPDSDSDDPFLSTPPSSPSQTQADDLFSSPPAMDLSVTEDTEASSLMASPTSQQVSLFRYITQAVVSAPRSTDPARPSWHEKMLMYDPVILEDLTAWLNAGQLDRVGFDGEVAPGDIKKWCESKSVCCLWRVNLRGNERKRL